MGLTVGGRVGSTVGGRFGCMLENIHSPKRNVNEWNKLSVAVLIC